MSIKMIGMMMRIMMMTASTCMIASMIKAMTRTASNSSSAVPKDFGGGQGRGGGGVSL